MTILLFIVALCLFGFAFGFDALRGLVRIVLIGGAAIAVLIVAGVVWQMMGHPL